MTGILSIISIPLGYVMEFIYRMTGNYGLVLILLTVFVRICLLPLGIKQQKSMVETQKIQPKLQELQRKYKDDKEKLNQETMKLYQEHNVSPMAGCLPLLIQMPILFGLIQVIYHPITYMSKLFPEGLEKIKELYPLAESGRSAYEEIALANATGRVNFNFLGIDLSKIPASNKTEILVWILPILATVATYFSGQISQKMSGNQNASADNPAAGSMKMMNWMMPLMTIFFTYRMPGGAALYWFMSTFVSLIQSVVLMKIYRKDPLPAEGSIVEEKPVKKENPYKKKKKNKTEKNKRDL